jgi:thioester reductase-like protein
MTSIAPHSVPQSVLLTGATGNLGGQLCTELLARTPHVVYCLARGSESSSAADRLARHLADFAESVGATDRLIVIEGDIERPDLGIPARRYDALAETVDTVIHCAASVNLSGRYEQLEPPNVAGTRNVIAFARRRSELTAVAPRFHHVSTVGTFVDAHAAGIAEVDETMSPTMQSTTELGYPRSKVAAETEVRAAADWGLPVTFLRPGLVLGHSRTGRTGGVDLLLPLTRAAIAVGAAPTVGALPAEMLDIVARGILALGARDDAAGRAFHLVRPEPLQFADLFDALRRAGHRLDSWEPEQWWRRIDHCDDPAVLPMIAMREAFSRIITRDPTRRFPHVRCDATWAALAEAGVPRPPLDAAYLGSPPD